MKAVCVLLLFVVAAIAVEVPVSDDSDAFLDTGAFEAGSDDADALVDEPKFEASLSPTVSHDFKHVDHCTSAECHAKNQAPEYKDLSRHILVSGLADPVNSAQITNKFSTFGAVESVNEQGKNYVVTFTSLEAAKNAMHKLNGQDFKGVPLHLSFQCGATVSACDTTEYAEEKTEEKA